MKKGWTRGTRLAAIVAERGLSTTGFRRALKALVRGFFPDEKIQEIWEEEKEMWPDEPLSPAEYICEGQFEDWFGPCRIVPAAYRIRRTGDGVYDTTIEVYEVEGTVDVSEWKLAYYGNVADSDGPHWELHIIDRYDHEIVVESDDLMRFMSLPYWGEVKKKEELKQMRSRAVAQHHAPVVIELGVSEIQDVIYGLGRGHSHSAVAQRTGLPLDVVKATADLLVRNSVNPRDIVKDTHARWKAAYDAVRELGVQL